MPRRHSVKTGESFLFSFSFWLLVDASKSLDIRTVEKHGRKFRFYPPFRSGGINRLPMPPIRAENALFLAGRKKAPFPAKGELIVLAAIPQANDPTKMTLTHELGTDFKTKPSEFPMDSLRIDSFPGTQININQQVVNFLDRLRLSSRPWWINRSIDPIVGLQRNAFASDKFGQPLEMPYGGCGARTPNGIEKAVTNNI